jgi:2-keto-4-pentenoate hydratase/2-oxohepta-3-ene-1,7-dioic acid hydratase in catechol pathway
VRLVTYEQEGTVQRGALVGDSIAPLPHASVREILELGPVDLDAPDPAIALDDVRLLPPIPDPDKILCNGLNYRDHAEETGMPAPRFTPSRPAGPRSC